MSEGLATEPHYGDGILRIISRNDSQRIGILLRHSVKDKSNAEGDEAGLSQLGFAEARRFGRLLPKNRNLCLSYSPSPRCVETATEIMRGFAEGKSGSVSDKGAEEFHASFRFFSRHEAKMDSYKKSVGPKVFLREWLDGTLREDVMEPAAKVQRFLTNYFHNELEQIDRFTLRIWVSHDFSIMMMRELLFGAKFEREPWISYLDGLILTNDSNKTLYATWNGRSAPVPEL